MQLIICNIVIIIESKTLISSWLPTPWEISEIIVFSEWTEALSSLTVDLIKSLSLLLAMFSFSHSSFDWNGILSSLLSFSLNKGIGLCIKLLDGFKTALLCLTSTVACEQR